MDPYSDDALKAKISEAEEFLAALESGHVHIGDPFEGRTEAKIYHLKRQIEMYQSILGRRDALRP
jgi:hypothetical protein